MHSAPAAVWWAARRAEGGLWLHIISVRYPFCKMAHGHIGSDEEKYENNEEDE